MFGTFQEERPGEPIVYGLVDQPRFFDVIRHQVFYFPLLHSKVSSPSTWSDRLKSYLYGPGWFPGLPRLGDNNLVQQHPQRSSHFSQISLNMLTPSGSW